MLDQAWCCAACGRADSLHSNPWLHRSRHPRHASRPADTASTKCTMPLHSGCMHGDDAGVIYVLERVEAGACVLGYRAERYRTS
jgi:hypothetical protein